MQRSSIFLLGLFIAFTNCIDTPPIGDIRVYVDQATKDYSLMECKANLDHFIQVSQQGFWNQSASALTSRYGVDLSQVDNATLLINKYHDISTEISVCAYPRHRPVLRGFVVVSTYEQDLSKMTMQDKLNYLRTARKVTYDKIEKELRKICK